MHHGHKNKQKLTKTVFSVYLRDLNSGAPIGFVQFVPRFVIRCRLYSFIISMVFCMSIKVDHGLSQSLRFLPKESQARGTRLFAGREKGRYVSDPPPPIIMYHHSLYTNIYSANHGISFIRYLCRTHSKRAVLFIKTYEHHNKVVRRSWRC